MSVGYPDSTYARNCMELRNAEPMRLVTAPAQREIASSGGFNGPNCFWSNALTPTDHVISDDLAHNEMRTSRPTEPETNQARDPPE